MQRPALRNLWPALLVGSIVYAAGPNGAWMARQFTAPVPAGWGWFGAVLLGLAIFGGIKLAAQRSRIGIAIATVGGVVAVVIDAQYFAAAGHGRLLSLALGAFPTMLAVLAGIVEGIDATRLETRSAAEADRRLAWELREASKDREVQRRLQLRAPATQVNATQMQVDASASQEIHPATYCCPICGRNGMNRFVYAAHMRYCRTQEVDRQ